jgi:hypothetical protein
MGTSASNGGPKGSPPLLPDWYSPTSPDGDSNQNDNSGSTGNPEQNNTENAPNESPQPKQSGDWGKSKGALTRLSNSRSGASVKKAGNKYVNSLGGSKGATKAAAQGRITGSRYASFLGNIASGGINNALQNLGLDQFVGSSSEEICLALANAIAPPGTTNDEAIARDALISTLDSLYTRMQEEGSDFTNLEQLSLEQVKETLVEYVSHYIFNKWMYELGNAIEKGSVSESEAINLEIEVKDLIYTETIERYRDIPIESFNINDRSNDTMIEDIFQTAYSTLEQ